MNVIFIKKFLHKFTNYAAIFLLSLVLISCGSYSKIKDDANRPLSGKEKARRNIEEGRGTSLGGLVRGGKTNYEFSTSNPMWRASLETLDFLPLSNVDYSGGVIITDWYNDSSSNSEQIKITLRFLSNEIRSDSIKIIIHKKKCSDANNCYVNVINNSKINSELLVTIIKKAALFEKEQKKNKK